MRGLSVHQPWASAIAIGSKRIETRSWKTAYRGPLAIHASKRKRIDELIHWHSHWNWLGAMRPLGWSWTRAAYQRDIDALPFGAIVAVCNLVDCRPTDGFTQAELDTPRRPANESSDLYDWTERQLGNYALGRYGLVLENVRLLAKPIPFRGSLGLFDVPDELFAVAA